MPTPVSIARQCLAEEAAAALNDAVAVAKRRSHAQTTSLHAVSALIALPSSSLRDACTRGRTGAFSPRLQFRALELCVGVALDRVSACKSTGEDPPVSNSLMAAIKRSQANQRRDPETFHLYQQQLSWNSNSSSPPSICVVKVELKHFVMSILDDPIVSRVFGDAGFLTNDLKLAIVNPRAMSRFSAIPRCPPLFSCGLSDSGFSAAPAPCIPFKTAAESDEENLKRVGEILVKTDKRNPILVGVCAEDAFMNFMHSLNNSKPGISPKEIYGLSLISIDFEISKFLDECSSEEMLELKFNEVRGMSENCHGQGVIVNCGDLKALVDVESTDIVIRVISFLKRLLNNSEGKLWLTGFLSGDGDYKKLLERFPSFEMDLDLHLLPITSSKHSVGGKYFKSSLMGSFVPFAGFFSMPFEQVIQGSNATESSSLCTSCRQKYQQEVTGLKGTSIDSVPDIYSTSLSSWHRMTEGMTSKRSDTIKAQDDKTVRDFRVTVLLKKWSGICQQLHRHCTTQESLSEAELQATSGTSFDNDPTLNCFQVGSKLDGNKITNTSTVTPSDLSSNPAPKPEYPKPVLSNTVANVQLELSVQARETDHFQEPSCYQQQQSLPDACTYSSPAISVTTDLGLGTLYTCDKEVSRKPNLQEPDLGLRNLATLPRTHKNIHDQVPHSSLCSRLQEKQVYAKDLEYPWKLLTEKVYWQIEAIQSISQTLCCCLNGDVRHQCRKKGNHWLSFLGPDKVGKRKIAATLAEIFFGGPEHLLSLDLSSLDVISPSNSIFDLYDSTFLNVMSRRKIIVDFIAEELSKRPHSVVLLENIEKADFLVQSSLSLAIKTGKFPDSHGRNVSINNIIFVITSKFPRNGQNLIYDEVTSEFSEEKVLGARNLQMEILVGSGGGDFGNSSNTNVSVTPMNGNSNKCALSKRKLQNHDFARSSGLKRGRQLSRSIIDLNLPLENIVDDINTQRIDEDDWDSENSKAWMEELLENVDINVPFKPFAFDSLVQRILKEIDARLQRVVGAKILLEIDREVMNQILAAAWLTDSKAELENWIEQVLCSSVKEALQKHRATSDFLFRLASCNELGVKDRASGLCLPARINLS